MRNFKLVYLALIPLLTSLPARSLILYVVPAIKNFILSIVGITLGVGLGLGLASFILKELEEAREREKLERLSSAANKTNMLAADDNLSSFSRSLASSNAFKWNNSTTTVSSTTFEDGNSYASLMSSAGYSVPQGVLRGQIITKPLEDVKLYHFHPKVENRPSLMYGHLYHIFTHLQGDNTKPLTSESTSSSSKGIHTFQRLWPNLPSQVHTEMGLLIDLIIRDYVTCWYTSVDDGIAYHDEKEKRQLLAHTKELSNTRNSSLTVKDRTGTDSSLSNRQEQVPVDESNHIINYPSNATSFMVMSTAHIRSSPFLEILYNSLVTVMGSIATYAAGNINIADFLFTKLIGIITANIKTYRELRVLALKKCQLEDKETSKTTYINTTVSRGGGGDLDQEDSTAISHSSPLSRFTRKWISVPEIAITREFLASGKLHRACTFGLDVTSLLFADPYGKDDATSSVSLFQDGCHRQEHEQQQRSNTTPSLSDENKVLEQRLFLNNGRILYECELDYNRLLAHRLCRILIPRNEFASPVVRSLSVEMLAACVLTPIMGCFIPEYMNGWIISALDNKSISENVAPPTESSSKPVLDNLNEDNMPASAIDLNLPLSASSNHVVSVDVVIDQPYTSDVITEDSDADLDEDSINGDGSIFGVEGEYSGDPLENDDTVPALSKGDSADEDQEVEEDDDNISLESADSSLENRTENVSCPSDIADTIQYSLARALIDLQSHIDLEEVRIAKDSNKIYNFDWEACRNAVQRLALVTEAALLHGLRKNIRKVKSLDKSGDKSIQSDDPESVHDAPNALAQLLMDVTGDLDHFSNDEEDDCGIHDDDEEDDVSPSLTTPSMTVIATLRTLIAAWLQTGSVFRIMSCIKRSRNKILLPFYHKDAFLRCEVYGSGFTRQLRPLDEIEIPVDTVLIRGDTSANLNIMDALLPDPSSISDTDPARSITSTIKLKEKPGVRLGAIGDNIKANFVSNKKRLSQIVRVPGMHQKSALKQHSIPVPTTGHSNDLPTYLQFHPNDAYTANLRLERERRFQTFVNSSTGIEMICRSRGATERHILQHKELHSLSKYFYGHTLLLSLQNALPEDNAGSDIEQERASTILMIKGVSVRRRFLLPEDDSSFLLTRFSQSRPLEPIGMHSDQRDHNLSFKAFAASYEEPVVHLQSKRYTGGRVLRRCVMRYFPSDRSATVIMSSDNRCLDNRSGIAGENQKKSIIPSLKSTVLSKEYLSIRHLCYKTYNKGSEKTGSLSALTAGSSMDIDDFNATPRSGKATDFVYRKNLYENPVAELTSKRFTIEDSSVMAAHRADASCLELSDGSLSYALLISDVNLKKERDSSKSQDDRLNLSSKCPNVLMKLSDSLMSHSDSDRKVSSEVRPYSTSFIRAALLIASSRRESLLQVC